MDSKKSIIIAESFPICLKGLADLISLQPDLKVVGAFDDYNPFIAAIGEFNPEAVILSAVLDIDSIELTKTVHGKYPKVPIIAFSMIKDPFYAERVLKAGARGYVLKHDAPDVILRAVREVIAGRIFVSEIVANHIFQKFVNGKDYTCDSLIGCLNDREIAVFRYIGQGFSTKKIAEKFNLSPKSVQSYRESIKRKLNLEDSHDLIKSAVQWMQNELVF
ncbi:MAG: response regulator transcription factor [Candidatus Edwardsbacteria bacterium]|nr:response regulator transcription factor [Candidatus Edwardsbacteria bacterium]MBU1575861.1 response regulator transcription factor [Candidatus Edwardsbacteria bacterium]MBU2463647.1 response regulator transcription factor [Candidatus Edwardsbacteria bacterium]MBU2593075.1 response regulator transcription factor [Candidatus Edwardsbacteria bacterium]